MALTISILLLFFAFLKPGAPAVLLEPDLFGSNFTEKTIIPLKEFEKEIVAIVKSITKVALPYFVRNSNFNVSSSCISTLMQMFMDLRKLKVPVIKMLDAMAKPPSGILKGAFSIMGDYDECLEVKANKKGDVALTEAEEVYHGQYCMIEAELPPALGKGYIDYRNQKINLSAFGKLGELVAEIPAVNFADNYYVFKIGICMPSTCSTRDLQELLSLAPLQLFPVRAKYCDDGRMEQLNVGQIIFITFIILLGIVVITGTITEMNLYMKSSGFQEPKSKFAQFLLAFSLYRNTKKLMKSERTTYQIPVINGMYVIGSLLVIIYHTYFMPFFTSYSTHGQYLGQSMNDWKFTIMSTMGISIDAYFLFSGVFMTYPRYRREGEQIEVNVFKILFRRYLRFCPSMLVILGIMVTLPLVGSGPVWPEIFGVAAENTRKWWWTYVLMYNNFLEIKDQSFFPLWFIPCLMQVTVIGAVLLWFMSKNLNFGIFLTVVASLSCNAVLGVLTYLRNYPLTYALYYYDKRDYIERTIYTSPLSHVASYGIGLLLGYFMAKKPHLKWSRTHVIIGWICSLFLIIGNQLFCYIGHKGQDLDPILTAVYAATHRSLYSLGMAWIILACKYGYGGAFAEFLSWNGFGVLAKLSYSGYLIHYVVTAYHVSFTRVPLAFSHYETFIRYCGYITVSIAASFVLYITFELPMSYIESLLLSRRTDTNTHDSMNHHTNGKIFSDNILKENGVLDSSNLKPSLWGGEQKFRKREDSNL